MLHCWRAWVGSLGSSLLLIISVLLLWQLISAANILDSFLFPSPLAVLSSFERLVFGMEIAADFWSTLGKIGIALAVGSLAGLAIGTLISKWDALYEASSSLLDFFRSIPASALFPLFLLIFGAGDPTNTALATWICAIYLALHVSKGLRGTGETSLLIAKSLKKSELETFLQIRFREALPMIFVGFRTAVSLTVVVVIVTEMFVGTKSGLGKVLIDAAYMYDIPKLYAGILLVGITGYLLNRLVIYSEQRIVHWEGK